PTAIHAHGFITVNGLKMSKSRGTFINARTYLDYLDPEYLRYYFATKLSGSIDDLDINLEDFVQRVNSDLVGKVVNIASRCAGFIHSKAGGRLSASASSSLVDEFTQAQDPLAGYYEAGEFSRAMRDIMAMADRANQYIDEHKPWILAREEGNEAQVQQVCSDGINMFRILIAYLKPIMPGLAEKAEAFLNIEALSWQNIGQTLSDHSINKFTPLLTRIESEAVDKVVAASREIPAAGTPDDDTDQIDFDDFAKVDLRIVTIVNAEAVEGADKLLKLTLDLGDTTRTVFAGIKAAYSPDDLKGKMTVMVANLKPRKMRFGTSEGMVLAAGPGGKELYLLEPHAGAKPGMKVT
ncbi:MAG: methionine--tRNA ligase subunit beta, partial [Pseudohongiellaceae bacterium]